MNGVAEVPLTRIAIEACRRQRALSGPGPYLFPSEEDPNTHQKTFKTTWRATLRRAGVPYFRICDLRSAYATRLRWRSADEFVTQLLRQGDAKVFKKYSQMKLQMKRGKRSVNTVFRSGLAAVILDGWEQRDAMKP